MKWDTTTGVLCDWHIIIIRRLHVSFGGMCKLQKKSKIQKANILKNTILTILSKIKFKFDKFCPTFILHIKYFKIYIIKYIFCNPIVQHISAHLPFYFYNDCFVHAVIFDLCFDFSSNSTLWIYAGRPYNKQNIINGGIKYLNMKN